MKAPVPVSEISTVCSAPRESEATVVELGGRSEAGVSGGGASQPASTAVQSKVLARVLGVMGSPFPRRTGRPLGCRARSARPSGRLTASGKNAGPVNNQPGLKQLALMAHPGALRLPRISRAFLLLALGGCVPSTTPGRTAPSPDDQGDTGGAGLPGTGGARTGGAPGTPTGGRDGADNTAGAGGRDASPPDKVDAAVADTAMPADARAPADAERPPIDTAPRDSAGGLDAGKAP